MYNKRTFFFIITSALLVLLVGCSTIKKATKDIDVRAYMQDKQRVDQKINGNAGYIIGNPPKEAMQSPSKKTRKIYVLEFTKELDQQTKAEVEANTLEKTVYEDNNISSSMKKSSAPVRTTPKINLPSFDDDMDTTMDQPKGEKLVDYVVQKDDTLQKISKKFYDSYSKWSKIYDVNRSVIKDPDHIKPGITIQIPTE